MANDDEAKVEKAARAEAEKAAKAAKAKADEEAKAAKARADADKLAAKLAAKADKKALQDHVLTREVKHDGEDCAVGDTVPLTRAQHAQLYAAGAVATDWRD
ncbi:hypothetical protein [Rhodopseudomonas palustris]|uniref:hypothetical protein n=1 Tax=Rhodopseudomonas palustris TaxID=1076 RepID=UPI00140246C4|nr:hypothetical protein [Rhodopseudomonas palustris]